MYIDVTSRALYQIQLAGDNYSGTHWLAHDLIFGGISAWIKPVNPPKGAPLVGHLFFESCLTVSFLISPLAVKRHLHHVIFIEIIRWAPSICYAKNFLPIEEKCFFLLKGWCHSKENMMQLVWLYSLIIKSVVIPQTMTVFRL